MLPPLPTPDAPQVPDAEERRLAREALQPLVLQLVDGEPVDLEIASGAGAGTTITLPPSALALLVAILDEMAQGNGLALLPQRTELTTQQAADVLGVSRPHLIKLLERGVLPHHKVGSHRRVRLADLLAYQRQRDAARLEALAELAEVSQELGLDD